MRSVILAAFAVCLPLLALAGPLDIANPTSIDCSAIAGAFGVAAEESDKAMSDQLMEVSFIFMQKAVADGQYANEEAATNAVGARAVQLMTAMAEDDAGFDKGFAILGRCVEE
jgi:hypothetical protein